VQKFIEVRYYYPPYSDAEDEPYRGNKLIQGQTSSKWRILFKIVFCETALAFFPQLHLLHWVIEMLLFSEELQSQMKYQVVYLQLNSFP
jgi:hypothetical protein